MVSVPIKIMEMNQQNQPPVLVTGATGKQGGAVVQALLKQGNIIRALVRDPQSKAATTLEELGVQLVRGDMRDKASLLEALVGVRSVFSVQSPDMNDMGSDTEQVQGRNLVEAAKAANVRQFVHSSVSGAGDYHRNAPGWEAGRWDVHYWESKAYTEGLVRHAGFPFWTIIKPAFFMENFIRPSFLFANWVEDRLLTILQPDTAISLVAVRDIGTAAVAAINDPEPFNKVELEFAGDRLTMTQIAQVLADAWSIPLEAPAYSPEEAIAHGMMPVFVPGQQWLNEIGSPARPAEAQALGIPVTDFRTWAIQTAPGR